MSDTEGFRTAMSGFRKQDVIEYIENMQQDFARQQEEARQQSAEKEEQLRDGLRSANEMLVQLSEEKDQLEASLQQQRAEIESLKELVRTTSDKRDQAEKQNSLQMQQSSRMIEDAQKYGQEIISASCKRSEETLKRLAQIVIALDKELAVIKKQILATQEELKAQKKAAGVTSAEAIPDKQEKETIPDSVLSETEPEEAPLDTTFRVVDSEPQKKSNIRRFVDGFFGN